VRAHNLGYGGGVADVAAHEGVTRVVGEVAQVVEVAAVVEDVMTTAW
jgi:hypothetical protein